MKSSTIAIISFFVFLLLAETALIVAVASTGKPYQPGHDVEYVPPIPESVEPVSADDPAPAVPESTGRQGRMEVTIDVPMVLVMPQGSECALPLDGSVYSTDTLVIIAPKGVQVQ